MHPFIQTCYESLETMHGEFEKVIAGLPQEALDWDPGEGMNSIGVLVVHTCGSSRYWIGDLIGGDPSGRIRDQEFKASGRSAEELAVLLRETLAHHRKSMENLSLESLEEMVESPVHGRSFKKAWGLIHMVDHTAQHLGHIQVTRQLWEQKNAGRSA